MTQLILVSGLTLFKQSSEPNNKSRTRAY